MATKAQLLAQAAELGLEVPSNATVKEIEALLKSRTLATGGIVDAPLQLSAEKDEPEAVVPMAGGLPRGTELDAERLMVQRPTGPFRGGIIVGANGRCAICNGVADHVHTYGSTAAGGELTHADARAAEPVETTEGEDD